MGAKANYLKANKLVVAGTLASLALNLSLWLAIYFWFRETDEAIPLGYDVYFGVSSTGPWLRLFKYPLIGLAIIAINFLFTRRLAKREDKVIVYLLAFGSLLTQGLLLLEGLLLFNL